MSAALHPVVIGFASLAGPNTYWEGQSDAIDTLAALHSGCYHERQYQAQGVCVLACEHPAGSVSALAAHLTVTFNAYLAGAALKSECALVQADTANGKGRSQRG